MTHKYNTQKLNHNLSFWRITKKIDPFSDDKYQELYHEPAQDFN